LTAQKGWWQKNTAPIVGDPIVFRFYSMERGFKKRTKTSLRSLGLPPLKLTKPRNTSFLLGWSIFRDELLVSERITSGS